MTITVVKQVAPKRLRVGEIERGLILRVQRKEGVIGISIRGRQIRLERSAIPGQRLRDSRVSLPGFVQQASRGRSAQGRSNGRDLLLPVTGDVELRIERSERGGQSVVRFQTIDARRFDVFIVRQRHGQSLVQRDVHLRFDAGARRQTERANRRHQRGIVRARRGELLRASQRKRAREEHEKSHQARSPPSKCMG